MVQAGWKRQGGAAMMLCKALWRPDSKPETDFNEHTCDVLEIYQCYLNCFWTPLIYYIIITADIRALALGCFIIWCGLMLCLQFGHLLFITSEILFSSGIFILKVQILLDPTEVLLLIDKPLFFFINLARRKALRKGACGGQRSGVIWSAMGKDRAGRVIWGESEVTIPESSTAQREGELKWEQGQRKCDIIKN